MEAKSWRTALLILDTAVAGMTEHMSEPVVLH